RRVFSSDLDGRPIRGKDVLLLIESDVYKRLDDNDAVSLCCVGILQLVLLGVEDRRHVPNWILRLANDRVSWDNYPWGSYVWPTLYKHLRDANVKRWQPLYASDPTNETDTKSYSIESFAWAFKGQLPVERLVPDETEARSRWWVSSRAYFDGSSFEEEQIPRHLNRNNYFEVPSEMYQDFEEQRRGSNYLLRDLYRMRLRLDRDVPSKMYRDFEEQRRGYQQMKEKNADMYEKMTRFMEDMRRVPEANTTPMIADQHFGSVPRAFHTLADNSSFFNMPTPSNLQTLNQSNWLSPSNWQTPNQSYLGTPNSQPPIPSQPGTSNWQNQMPSRRQDARILGPNLYDRARREPQLSVYMLSPYTVLQPTTVLTKKKVDKTKKKGKTKKLSPLNLGNNFADENVSVDDVTITGVHQTDNYFNYETVDPDKVTRDGYVPMTEFLLDPYDIYLDCYMKGYKLPSFFWPQLVPHLCTYRCERSWPEGWLSSDVQILIRERTENANWTLAKSGAVCLHPENNRFMILTDPHNIRTLDGSVRPFPSWNDVTWVYMPINAGGVHWVTGAINLTDLIFYVFDSMESESRMLMLEQQVNNWTSIINSILETRGYFHATG
nr:phospholipase-like protein [Tanacetum cinerariifolium]